jgi:hypothetical protein
MPILDRGCENNKKFGFVKRGGTNKAIFAVESVIDMFNSKCSDVYLCSLDAEKAYDRVNHYFYCVALFLSNVPFSIVQILCILVF